MLVERKYYNIDYSVYCKSSGKVIRWDSYLPVNITSHDVYVYNEGNLAVKENSRAGKTRKKPPAAAQTVIIPIK